LSFGLSIPHIKLPNFKAEQLYIKLDKKLILQAKRINVTISNKPSTDLSFLKIPKVSSIVNFSLKNFQSFKINELNIGDQKVTLSYTENSFSPSDNKITIKSDKIDASIFYRVYDNYLLFDMLHAAHKPSNVLVSGKGLYDFNREKSYAHLELSLPDCASVQLYTKENGKELAFTASSNNFTKLSPIVELFNLKKNTVKWITEKNTADSYELLQAKGLYSYTDSERILDTLFIRAREKNVSYTFNKALFPIIATQTDVSFSKGILQIKPSNARYGKHLIDKSTISLDFNPKHITLTIDLNIDTTLDQDIVDIVQAYHITLPLRQEKGKTKTHLEIVIDLWSEEAYATGQFFVQNSDLILDGVRYKVKNAAIRLYKNTLNIDTAKLAYENILVAKVNGQIDLSTLVGDFFYDVQNLSLPLSENKKLQLLNQDIQIKQHFSHSSEHYTIPQTDWFFEGFNITVDPTKVTMPIKFVANTELKNVNVHIQNLADLNVSGNFDIRRNTAYLDINSTHVNYLKKDVNLSSVNSTIPLVLTHENNITHLKSIQKSTLFINGNQLDVMPTSLYIKDNYLDINNTRLSLDRQFSTKLSTHYNLGSNRAKFIVSDTILLNKEFLFLPSPFELLYEEREDQHYFDINALDIHAVLNESNQLDLHIKNFSKLYPYSDTMQLYGIKNGHADFTVIDNRVGMDLMLKNFYPLLSNNGNIIRNYSIKGDYQNKTANLQINKNIDLLYRKKGKLTAKNIDFNLFPILDYLERIETKNEKNSLELLIKTKNCNVSLGSSGRKILSDSIKIHIKRDEMNAQLVHGQGGVLFESHDHNISVFGRGLNDSFMNELFKFSTFKGGKLSFVMQGPFDNLHGIMNINKTVIKDYTVLNNILAFFNTIPSLMTFSVPDYSKDGLSVKEMYASFHKTGSKIQINDAKISSKELLITAKGESDFEKENIEMLMQVKTDLGSTAKNIPILGYIIFGDDTVSTTVRVHGPLNNPKVESSVAKSIISAPYNILRRTITLPLHVIDFLNNENNQSR